MSVFLFAYTLEICHMSLTMTRLKVIVRFCSYPYRIGSHSVWVLFGFETIRSAVKSPHAKNTNTPKQTQLKLNFCNSIKFHGLFLWLSTSFDTVYLFCCCWCCFRLFLLLIFCKYNFKDWWTDCHEQKKYKATKKLIINWLITNFMTQKKKKSRTKWTRISCGLFFLRIENIGRMPFVIGKFEQSLHRKKLIYCFRWAIFLSEMVH